MCEPRVALWTAHGNPLKVLLTEELDEATAKGPRALADYLAPTLRWCGLEPSLMGPLLNYYFIWRPAREPGNKMDVDK